MGAGISRLQRSTNYEAICTVRMNYYARCDEYLHVLNNAQTLNKITEQCNVDQTDLKYYEVINGGRLTYYAKYDINPVKSVEDIRQNQ